MKTDLRIGVYNYTLDLSVRNYIDNLSRELSNNGVAIQLIGPSESLPENVDLYWQPTLTGTIMPSPIFRNVKRPFIITMHDGAPLALPPWEYSPNFSSFRKELWRTVRTLFYWRTWRNRCAAIITVSNSAKRDIINKIGLKGENIIPIYHGVNHEIFKPTEEGIVHGSYLLHVSQFQPKKNFLRILKAYQSIKPPFKLIAVVPGCPGSIHVENGNITINRSRLLHQDIIPLYQGSMGFLFPSLHETFGMPIIEAMACGCPVITSDRSACVEVAGDAAVLVDPYSVRQIRSAILQVSQNPELRSKLRARGLRRAQDFSWVKSAEEHLNVFQQVLRY